jgi:urease beta subunit
MRLNIPAGTAVHVRTARDIELVELAGHRRVFGGRVMSDL